MNKLRSLWEDIRSSLWFIPTLIVAGAVALAGALIEADTIVSRERLIESWPRMFGAGAEGSRGLLSAIAGSMITVAEMTYTMEVDFCAPALRRSAVPDNARRHTDARRQE